MSAAGGWRGPRREPRRGGGSLAVRLFAAQVLVIVAGSLTLALVAVAVAPGVFHAHVRRALGTVPPTVAGHLDQALGDALGSALLVAAAVALLAAVAVSWLAARRIVGPVRALAGAAATIARGGYGARVPLPGAGAELDALASSFNAMAEALEGSERRRRELLADLGHELRTPLATIEGYVEGLADGVVAADAETWAVLGAETARLGRLVGDLDRVSRAEERQLDLRVAPWEPGALVAVAVRSAAAGFAAKGVALDARCDRSLPRVAVDADRIGEVLANLLGNALRHTPPGGRVEVAAVRRGGGVELSVADTGEGLPAEPLERVFERFYRADPARARQADGGSGIGLTICRAIVQAHGGRIHAESDGPGRGARFVVTLPAAGG